MNEKIIILEYTIKINKNNNKEKWVKYKCKNCGYEGEMRIDHVLNGNSCPVCCVPTKKVVKGINDIATTHPHFVKYFVDIEDTYKYSFGSAKKVDCKCPDCGTIRKIIIHNLIRKGFSCKVCGDKISIPNKIMFNVLEQLQVDFESEKKFDWCKYLFKDKLRQGYYDFYIPSKNLIIEMDGGWHTKNNNLSGQTAKESKFIDNEKDRLALEYGISVIRIDCNYEYIDALEYIEKNILDNNRLNELFDLFKIDWLKCKESLYNNKVKEACDLWNKGINSTKEIGEIIKLSTNTIAKYLKIGKSLKWCDYDALVVKRNNGLLVKQPIKCLETEEFFESIIECSRRSLKIFGIKMSPSWISNSILLNKQCYGYTFIHA